MAYSPGEQMDEETCYEWGNLFASPWDDLLEGMSSRASQMGLTQEIDGNDIIWVLGSDIKIKYCFIPDPSDITSIRRIFNDESNARVPV